MFRLTVEPCTKLIVSAANLDADDRLVLWRLACEGKCPDDGTEVYIEFKPANCEFAIDATHNPLLIDVPGVYELRFVGATNTDVRVCKDTYLVCKTC